MCMCVLHNVDGARRPQSVVILGAKAAGLAAAPALVRVCVCVRAHAYVCVCVFLFRVCVVLCVYWLLLYFSV